MAPPGRKHVRRRAAKAACDVQHGADSPGIGDSGENCPCSGTLDQDMRNEIQDMLERFEGKMKKVLYEKRKRFKMNTDASLNTMQRKVEHAWKTHQEQWQKLCLEYSQQFQALIQEWDLGAKKLKEEEEKLASILLQLQKSCDDARLVERRRMRELEELHVEFLKSIEDLEEDHGNLVGEGSELRKELAALQSKLMMQNQREEVANVEMFLRSLLF